MSWEEVTQKTQASIRVGDYKETIDTSFEYIICLSVNGPGEAFDKNFLMAEKEGIIFAARLSKKLSSKCVFVFPFIENSQTSLILSAWVKELLDDKNLFAAMVFLGEVMFKEDQLAGNNGLARSLEAFIKEGRFVIPKNEKYFFPIYASDAVSEITRSLFSLRAYGQRTAVISKPVSVEEFFRSIKKLKPQSKLFFAEEAVEIKLPEVEEFVYKDFNSESFLSAFAENLPAFGGVDEGEQFSASVDFAPPKPAEKIPWALDHRASSTLSKRFGEKKMRRTDVAIQEQEATPQTVREVRVPRQEGALSLKTKVVTWLANFVIVLFGVKPSRISYKLFLATVVFGIIFFTSPYLLLGASISALMTARGAFEKNDVKTVEKAIKISQITTRVSGKYSLFLAEFPLVGGIYNKSASASFFLTNISDAGLTAISLLRTTLELSNQVSDESSSYDPSSYAKKISLDLDSLYSELGFLEGELDNYQKFPGTIVRKILGEINIQEARRKILLLEKISGELPSLLGKGKPATYLVLFQNNLNLSPAGGEIVSFGLISISNGKVVNLEVYESTFADNKLKGYVAPPEPLKKYFSESAWYLRNSNWDPAFDVSATKAEWFIDKEIDRAVDGVISVDVEILKAYLKEIGPLSLTGSERKATAENFYELILEEQMKKGQDSADSKADYFEEISEEFLNKILKLGQNDRVALAKRAITGMEEKHLQIFLHNREAQRALSSLGWDGGIYQQGCKGNCYSDLFGIVEANSKDSPPSFLVKKEADLTVSFEKGLVKRKLLFLLDNPAQGKGIGRYKSYVRVLAPEDSGFGPVEVVDGQTRKNIEPEVYGIRGHKEAGVFVELSPGETKALIFTWESGTDIGLDKNGDYLFYLRKQAGVLNYPIEVKFDFPENTNVSGDPDLTLTSEGLVGYNTLLSRDFVSRIFW